MKILYFQTHMHTYVSEHVKNVSHFHSAVETYLNVGGNLNKSGDNNVGLSDSI